MHIDTIVHGKSAARDDLREAVAAARGAGHRVTVWPTWEAGDAGRLTQRAVLEGADAVVAGGGDGTVNEVVMGLLTASGGPAGKPSFGILPLGTANDFARSAGIPLELTRALELVATRPARAVDVGRIGDRAFLNVATGGFGTQVTVETPEPMKKVLGGAAYLLTGLTRFSSIGAVKARFTANDFEWQGSFLVLAIGNGRQAGGGHVLCPDARIDDGVLNLSILPDVAEGELGQTMRTVLSEGLESVRRMTVGTKLTELDIEAESDVYINLDGEPIKGTRFHVSLLPSAIDLHLPEGSPLVDQAASLDDVAQP